jgi:hypothetical protein
MEMIWYCNADLNSHIALLKRFISEKEFNLAVLEQNVPML